MMMTANLFTAPHNHTETSIQAAKRQTPGKLKDRYHRVLRALSTRGPDGYTREELASVTGLNPNTINPRCNELAAMGLIVKKQDDEGRNVKRPTRSGSPAQVLVPAHHATHAEQSRP